jgi:2-keto-3-deoxy-6-phosphogluconate aldolase
MAWSFATIRFFAVIRALTPTEVIAAWNAGADFVKIYPCGHVGGDDYIRALKAPLPHVPLIASGGVNQQAAESELPTQASLLLTWMLLTNSDLSPHAVNQLFGIVADPSFKHRLYVLDLVDLS